MQIVVGLGNPGPTYANTRHNIGFLVLEEYAKRHNVVRWKDEVDALTATTEVAGTRLLLVKPMTYMNCSGEATGRLSRYFKVSPEDIIVVHDEVDHELSVLRVKQGGGEAGHNGLRSISSHLGSKQYVRVRFGVGRPKNPRMDTADWVLSSFSADEGSSVEHGIKNSCNIIDDLLKKGFSKTQNHWNRRKEK